MKKYSVMIVNSETKEWMGLWKDYSWWRNALKAQRRARGIVTTSGGKTDCYPVIVLSQDFLAS